MANVGKAFENLGSGLMMLWDRQAKREEREWLADRQENMARIQAGLQEKNIRLNDELAGKRQETEMSFRATSDAANRAHAQSLAEAQRAQAKEIAEIQAGAQKAIADASNAKSDALTQAKLLEGRATMMAGYDTRLQRLVNQQYAINKEWDPEKWQDFENQISDLLLKQDFEAQRFDDLLSEFGYKGSGAPLGPGAGAGGGTGSGVGRDTGAANDADGRRPPKPDAGTVVENKQKPLDLIAQQQLIDMPVANATSAQEARELYKQGTKAVKEIRRAESFATNERKDYERAKAAILKNPASERYYSNMTPKKQRELDEAIRNALEAERVARQYASY